MRRSRHTASAHSVLRHVLALAAVMAAFGTAAVVLVPGFGFASAAEYEIRGDGAELVRSDGSVVAASGAGALGDGDGLRTGADASASLTLGPGAVVRLGSTTAAGVGRDTDDDPAATPLHRVTVAGGHAWVRQDGRREVRPVLVELPAGQVRVHAGAVDVGCGAVGCTVRVVAGVAAVTVGWDRFRVHAGAALTIGSAGEVGTMSALSAAALRADSWVAGNEEQDEAAGFGGIELPERPRLADADIEGTWAVVTDVVETTTPNRPAGGEPQRTWGITRRCVDGVCELDIVDVASDRGAMGTAALQGDRFVVEGMARTYDCVDPATGEITVADAVAETRRTDLAATAAIRRGGRWIATELAGTGSGEERWAGRGRVCRGIRPGTWTASLAGTRVDPPA